MSAASPVPPSARTARTIGDVGIARESRMPARKPPTFVPRRRAVTLLASGLLLAACGGEEKKSGSFKMHKTIGDGPGM